MFNITISYPTAEAAIEALARLRGTEAAPGKSTGSANTDKAPAPSPRTAKAETAKADAASTKTDQPAEKPTKPAADEVTAEQFTATVLKFVPVPEHKAAALKVINGFKQADGTPCSRGREVQAGDRAAGLAQLKAIADELGVDLS
jgi:hypothetical protein